MVKTKLIKYIIQYKKANSNKILEYARWSKDSALAKTNAIRELKNINCTFTDIKLAQPKQQINYNGLPDLFFKISK
jgi:hypothetical protein